MASSKDLTDKNLLRRHAALHTIESRLEQGLKQGDWTKEKLRRAHEESANEIKRRDLKHESPMPGGRPDRSSHSFSDIAEMDDKKLLRFHANLHSLASKVRSGIVGTGWTMDQLAAEHDDVVVQMSGRGMEHASPLI